MKLLITIPDANITCIYAEIAEETEIEGQKHLDFTKNSTGFILEIQGASKLSARLKGAMVKPSGLPKAADLPSSEGGA